MAPLAAPITLTAPAHTACDTNLLQDLVLRTVRRALRSELSRDELRHLEHAPRWCATATLEVL